MGGPESGVLRSPMLFMCLHHIIERGFHLCWARYLQKASSLPDGLHLGDEGSDKLFCKEHDFVSVCNCFPQDGNGSVCTEVSKLVPKS